jgi:thioredoxin-related protein
MRELVLGLILVLTGPLAEAAGPDSGLGRLEAGMVNPGHHEQPAWFKESFLDIREDIAEARDNDKRVVLYFYQDGCPYCAKLLQDNLGDRAIADAMRSAFDVVSINLWGDREVTDFRGNAVTEKRFGAGLRVQFTPTLLFLNEDGRVVLRINGYFPPNKFAAAVDYVAGRHETRQTYSEFLAERQAAESSAKLNAVGDALPKPLQLADNRRESHRPLLILFEQTDCTACDELHQDVFKRREVATSLTNVDIAQLDLRSDETLTTPDG